ncbi:MAG: hypothetical protein KF690_01805 [Bacteroidetes bacterium]|nr:hypothetical protein [Bacteroidota bacterium]
MIKTIRLSVFLAACWLTAGASFAQNNGQAPVQEIQAWPRSIEDFVEMQRKQGNNPAGSAALLLVAFHVYTENPKLGEQMLTLIVHPELLVTSDTGYKGYALRASDLQLLKIQLRARTANSYFVGTTAENDYALHPKGPWKIQFRSSETLADPNASRYKIFVECNGADAPRPILLHREPANANGMWYVQDWSALLMPVR